MTAAELYRAWTVEGLSLGQIALRFKTTKAMVSGKLRVLRRGEGEERWPRRPQPSKPRPTPVIRPKRGQSTLPPLSST